MDAEYNFCLYFHQNSTQNILHTLSQAMTTLVITVKYHYWVFIILCIHAKFMNFMTLQPLQLLFITILTYT